MPSDVNVPHATLRFVEHEGYIWFLQETMFDHLVVQPMPDLELPILKVSGVHAGRDGIRIGYRFSAPRELTTVQPNFLLVAKSAQESWEPYFGLPGLQVYIGAAGVALISTRITRFFRALE